MLECRTRQPRLGFDVGGGVEAAGGFVDGAAAEVAKKEARSRSVDGACSQLSPEAARRSAAASRMLVM